MNKKGKSQVSKAPEIQYFSTSLKNIILAWSRNFMKRKDWEVEAIDVANDRVIYRRYQRPEEL